MDLIQYQMHNRKAALSDTDDEDQTCSARPIVAIEPGKRALFHCPGTEDSPENRLELFS